MSSPELLAWRQARKALKAFHKANPKLRGKYLALRRSLGHLTEYQTLVRSQGLDASSLTEGGQRMWSVLQTYKQAYSRLRRLEQEEFKTWDAYNDTLLDANYRLLKEMLRGS